MRGAVRRGDQMRGSVPHHANHIITWTSRIVDIDDDGNPITELVPVYCNGHDVAGAQREVSGNVLINGLGAARLGDKGSSSCPCDGCDFITVQGSSRVLVNGKPLVRVGDRVVLQPGQGAMTTGSPNVLVGG